MARSSTRREMTTGLAAAREISHRATGPKASTGAHDAMPLPGTPSAARPIAGTPGLRTPETDAFRYAGGKLTDADRAALTGFAGATWASFFAMAPELVVPTKEIRRQPDGSWRPVSQMSPTNIASHPWATVVVGVLSFSDISETRDRSHRTVATAATMDRCQGFHDRTSFARRSDWDGSARSSSPR